MKATLHYANGNASQPLVTSVPDWIAGARHPGRHLQPLGHGNRDRHHHAASAVRGAAASDPDADAVVDHLASLAGQLPDQHGFVHDVGERAAHPRDRHEAGRRRPGSGWIGVDRCLRRPDGLGDQPGRRVDERHHAARGHRDDAPRAAGRSGSSCPTPTARRRSPSTRPRSRRSRAARRRSRRRSR